MYAVNYEHVVRSPTSSCDVLCTSHRPQCVIHRFLKCKKYFFKATRQLPECKKATREEQEVKTEPLGPEPETVATQERTHTIVLLTTSEGEVSSDRDSNESEEEGTNVGDE